MITTEMVYWIVMLDNISGAFILAACVFSLFLFSIIGGILSNADDFRWPHFMLAVLELFFICGAVFLPNSKQMATIYLLPKIVNNEKIQSIGERTLDNGDKLLQLMQQYITEKMTKGGTDGE